MKSLRKMACESRQKTVPGCQSDWISSRGEGNEAWLAAWHHFSLLSHAIFLRDFTFGGFYPEELSVF